MSLGVEMLLPSDCLNINGFRAIHMNTHSDATWIFIRTELLPISIPYRIFLFSNLNLHKVALIVWLNITRRHDARGARWLSFFSIRQGIEGWLA